MLFYPYYFPQNIVYFTILSLFCSNKTIFINHAIKCEHQYVWIKVNDFCGKDKLLCYLIFFRSNNLFPCFKSYATSKVLLKKPKATQYFPQHISPKQTVSSHINNYFINIKLGQMRNKNVSLKT